MGKDYKSLESKMVDVSKTVLAVNAAVYVFEILIDTMIKQSGVYNITQTMTRILTECCNKGQITVTQAANFWSRLGLPDNQVNSLVLTLSKAHAPSGIPYSSGRIRWKTTQSSNPFLSPARKINSAGWERLTDSGTWEALSPSTSRAVAFVDPGDQERYTENDAGALTKDYASNWTAIDRARRHAISFSKEAAENPKLQRALVEGEVYSPSQIYASELSDSPSTSPFGERGGERYQYVGVVDTFSEPAGFRGSTFGHGVIILSILAVMGVIAKKFVFKRKETVVDKKQNHIPQKENDIS